VEALVPITMFLSIAMVLILRPVTKKLGLLIEAMSRERSANAEARTAADEHESGRALQLLEHVSRRLDLMEERLDFTERLVGSPASHGARSAGPRPMVANRESRALAP
jgi:hypothetical protein